VIGASDSTAALVGNIHRLDVAPNKPGDSSLTLWSQITVYRAVSLSAVGSSAIAHQVIGMIPDRGGDQIEIPAAGGGRSMRTRLVEMVEDAIDHRLDLAGGGS
jgi:hypothetical protein